ncbi:DUF1735 domain-containing protein [Flavisolibacter tropicus]|uniref:BT-3987-like N-terminal domain-containing protein n=1 Tax=Flavisolibacter tropicus TaxID=1492898 RepID=A0A172U0B2_9BACT|nr:DUF1735 domain-containing protein [Flavisolibacter tropicus]ANE52628.1 hypothetical protein SY85_21240 [Flavisolibacter tropicus]
MKKLLIRIIPFILIPAVLTSCLKKFELAEDFSSTQPIADLPKAPANALNATAPTNSWFILDSAQGTVDYSTAVHISAKDHVGDVTVRMKIDRAAGQKWIDAHPSGGYELLPEDLYTVPTLDVVIPNAGVFSVGDFIVKVKANANNGAGVSRFKNKKYILPVSIDNVVSHNFTVAENFRNVLWNMRVKLK